MAFSGLVMKIKTRENRYRKLGTPPQQPGLIRHFQDCFFVIFLNLFYNNINTYISFFYQLFVAYETFYVFI